LKGEKMSSRTINCELERSPVGLGLRKVAQWIDFSDFTDGGGAVGTLEMSDVIPAGSFVIGSKVTVKTGFTGDTTCTLGIESKAYSGNTTYNIFTAANNLMKAAFISADAGLVAVPIATTVSLTATSGSDWGLVTAGKIFVEVFYFSTNVELNDSYEDKFNG